MNMYVCTISVSHSECAARCCERGLTNPQSQQLDGCDGGAGCTVLALLRLHEYEKVEACGSTRRCPIRLYLFHLSVQIHSICRTSLHHTQPLPIASRALTLPLKVRPTSDDVATLENTGLQGVHTTSHMHTPATPQTHAPVWIQYFQ